jgi:hypothetical protein
MVPARPPVHVVALVCALVLICFGSSGFGQPRTGEILVPKGGAIKPEILDVIGSMRLQIPEIADVGDALAAATKLLDAGVDGIKL